MSLENSELYPIILRIAGRLCVVIGGGLVALAKSRKLVSCNARVLVVAPEVVPDFDAFPDIEYIRAPYSPDQLQGAFLAFAATNSPKVNARIARDCDKAGILCNVVDNHTLCNFTVPSVVKRDKLILTVSTSGASPALSKRIRQDLETLFPMELSDYVDFLNHARTYVRPRLSEADHRRALATYLASPEGYASFLDLPPNEHNIWLDNLINQFKTG